MPRRQRGAEPVPGPPKPAGDAAPPPTRCIRMEEPVSDPTKYVFISSSADIAQILRIARSYSRMFIRASSGAPGASFRRRRRKLAGAVVDADNADANIFDANDIVLVALADMIQGVRTARPVRCRGPATSC